MDVSDTKPLEKCCSKCGVTKIDTLFIPKRNICKECRNAGSREKYKLLEISNETEQKCNVCSKSKLLSLFIKNRKICVECNNDKRRTKYEKDETYRIIQIQKATDFKQKRAIARNKQKEEEIGVDNKRCSCCNDIKHQTRFRYNRLKCRDCERDDILDKLKRVIRSRIISALTQKNEQKYKYK
jgi:uncharacterized protein (DUF983 family)